MKKQLFTIMLVFVYAFTSAQRFQYDTTKYDPFPEITKSNEKGKQEYKEQCIKAYGKVIGTKLSNQEIWLGMTKDMAEWAKGSMHKTTDVIKKGIKYELWRYDDGTWLTFKQNKLVLIQ